MAAMLDFVERLSNATSGCGVGIRDDMTIISGSQQQGHMSLAALYKLLRRFCRTGSVGDFGSKSFEVGVYNYWNGYIDHFSTLL